ncbi:MAG: phosphate signaling complex protein PhoU [Anaerolineales bacterium]|nr:phosphate signaling complex protein PhoU [Anaerolineales bacterium]
MAASTRTHFDQELRALQDNLLRMGAMLDTAIALGMQSLEERDLELARRVVADDAKINDLRFAIEEQCIRLIATQQPMATDLRFIVAAMNIISDLERMADHAAGIAKTVLKMGNQPLLKPLIDMPRMAEECRAMLRSALDAYVARDAEAARGVAARDDVIDELYQQIFRELVSFIIEDPKTTTRALYLLFSAHNLERIGDRVVNIAERVIFLTSGEMKELSAGPWAPFGNEIETP